MAVRRVRRIIRRFDPWTVLKVSAVFNAIASLSFVLGTWVLWSVVVQRGLPERISELLLKLDITFVADGELYFRIVLLLAVVWAIVMTGLFTVGAVLYNLIADLVGGVEAVVLEESHQTQGAEAPSPSAKVTPPKHRPPIARAPAQSTQQKAG
ncbi:MAG: hypothetical protein HKN93_08795 [Acidimicrobiia bacterium]|nr:hypothetical protein [Acidimicrobiia bacterium]